jgi:hypothetical protein
MVDNEVLFAMALMVSGLTLSKHILKKINERCSEREEAVDSTESP